MPEASRAISTSSRSVGIGERMPEMRTTKASFEDQLQYSARGALEDNFSARFAMQLGVTVNAKFTMNLRVNSIYVEHS